MLCITFLRNTKQILIEITCSRFSNFYDGKGWMKYIMRLPEFYKLMIAAIRKNDYFMKQETYQPSQHIT